MKRSLRVRRIHGFEPEWVKTEAQRRRWRQYFAVGLLDHCGCSSRFIADAIGISDSQVRAILRSELSTHVNYSAFLAAIG